MQQYCVAISIGRHWFSRNFAIASKIQVDYCVLFAGYWSYTLSGPEDKMHLKNGFPCTLAGKEQPRLPMLRFHVGSQAAHMLLDTPNFRVMLDADCINKLNDFLQQLGNRPSPERTYALLGQSYLSQVVSCQAGDVAIAFSRDFDGSENFIDIMGRYHQKLVPLVDAFDGFHDLEEDDDGDEDEENYRLSLDRASSDDEIDEPDGR